MTLSRTQSGIFEGDFRAKGMARLHLSLRTKVRRMAEARHDAVLKLIRQKRWEMLAQLRAGVLSIERLEAMIEHHEPLAPMAAAIVESMAWGTVEANAERYLRWVQAHPKKSDGTHAIAGYQLAPFLAFVFEGKRTGDRELTDVPRALISAYQQTYLDAGRSPNVTTSNMARVGALWRWIVTEEGRDAIEQRRAPRPLYVPVNPDELVREYRPRERFLSEAEISSLLGSTPGPMLFHVYCGLGAGLRLGEMLHLRPSLDADAVQGLLSIRAHDGWKPKTRRSTRVVPMADDLQAIAARHIASWASDRWMAPSPRDPKASWTETGFRLHFKEIVERAGLTYGRDKPEGVTFHTLRHTFASHAVMQGVDLYSLAQLLGDALDTVEATYAHLSPDFKRAAMVKVAAAIKLPQGVTQK